jgi:hypothetical protein
MKFPTDKLTVIAHKLVTDHSPASINKRISVLTLDEVESLRLFCDKIMTYSYDRVAEIEYNEDENLLKELKNAHYKKWTKGE